MDSNNKNRAEFLSLFMSNHKAIYAYILAVVCDIHNADDLMQETVLFLWDHFDQYKSGTSFIAWARSVSRYKILQFFDRNKKEPAFLTHNLLEAIEKDLDQREHGLDEQFRILQNCLEKLPAEQRQLLQDKYNKGLNINQIAGVLGNTANALYKRMARIHLALLDCMNRSLKIREANP
ncbi:MAG: sigma-70 family RNA polymerase sigma factor [Sedimentisphaerales bacterium]|nr:sigma-70 family RNA polymerase sigma factor [Sedimentisphaerales bacterium]